MYLQCNINTMLFLLQQWGSASWIGHHGSCLSFVCFYVWNVFSLNFDRFCLCKIWTTNKQLMLQNRNAKKKSHLHVMSHNIVPFYADSSFMSFTRCMFCNRFAFVNHIVCLPPCDWNYWGVTNDIQWTAFVVQHRYSPSACECSGIEWCHARLLHVFREPLGVTLGQDIL